MTEAQDLARRALERAIIIKDALVEAEQGRADLLPSIECHRDGELAVIIGPTLDDGEEYGSLLPLRCLHFCPGAFGADAVVTVTEMVHRRGPAPEHGFLPGQLQEMLEDDPFSRVGLAVLAHVVTQDEQAFAFSGYEYIEAGPCGLEVAWDDQPVIAAMDGGMPDGIAAVVRASMRSFEARQLRELRMRGDINTDRFVAEELAGLLGASFVVHGELVR